MDEELFNIKYESLPGQFFYKNVCYASWTKLEFIQRIEDEDIFYSDDTLVATYPKSGTTVLDELVWLISNNVDIEQARNLNIIYRCPFIEENSEFFYPNLNVKGYAINIINRIKRPRFLKSHLQYRNLETQLLRNPNMKVITCLRNPKDTAVSFYHFQKAVSYYGPYKGAWDEFFEKWYDGWISGGDWLDVVTEWWSQRQRKNVKIIFFEDIISNRKMVINDLCKFLNKTLAEDEVEKLTKHTEFTNMKMNPSTNYTDVEGFTKEGFSFMRKGKIGDWKNYFSEEQSKRLDEKYGPVLLNVGLQFRYE